MLLMRSPIMRRSSSICASPGPPRVPMPPRWRSRWLQRRTRRVDRYCRRASSTWSLPSWLCARSPKISRISMVRSATATPRWRSRLRCCAGDSAWSKMHRFGLVQLDELLQLVGLARADEEGRVGRLAARDDARDGDVACRLGEQRELVERFVEAAPGRRSRRRRGSPRAGAAPSGGRSRAQRHRPGGEPRLKAALTTRAGSGSSPPGRARRSRSRACRPSG